MKKPFTKIRLQKKNSNTANTSNATAATATRKQMSFKQSVFLLVFASIGLLGASGYYWYQNILTNPDRIISDMLDKSLQTSSVSRTVEQRGPQNQVQQAVYVGFTPKTLSRSVTNLQESSSAGTTSVVTETIGTEKADYVRYNAIDVPQTNANSSSFESVLNKWGKREGDPTSGQPLSFLNDALFVVVPFGNLNTEQRQKLKIEIHNVGLYKTSKTETEFINGRPVISYLINVDPQALVQVLAKYVELTGIGSSDQLNPALYEGAAKIQVNLQVDVLSRHVKEVSFVGADRAETYGGYNAIKTVPLPTDTISIEDLQKRLTEVEKQQQTRQKP